MIVHTNPVLFVSKAFHLDDQASDLVPVLGAPIGLGALRQGTVKLEIGFL
jgi:hypothetical protein